MCQYKYTKYSKKTSFKEESIKMSLKESWKFYSKTHHWLTYSLDERVCGVSPIRSKSGTPLSAGPREVSSPSTCCSTKSLKIPLRLNLDLEQTWEDDPVCYWRQSDCSTHGSGSGSHPWYQGDVNQRKVGLWLLQQERERAERAGYYDARVSCWYQTFGITKQTRNNNPIYIIQEEMERHFVKTNVSRYSDTAKFWSTSVSIQTNVQNYQPTHN